MIPDQEDNWFSLIDALKNSNVIPVIGPDLLDIEVQSEPGQQRTEKLEALIEHELDRRYGIQTATVPTGGWHLHDYVARLLSSSQPNPDKIRRAIASALAAITSHCPLPQALTQLASIDAFQLFVSLTCDDLLFRALLAADPEAESFAFGIRSDTNARPLDIPIKPKGKVSYQLLGSAENPLDFAIHEGDVLEYLFRLQSEQARSVQKILGRIRGSNLLLIGCHLPDWLGRTLLRLANNDPLQSKSTQEFMTESDSDPALTTFISRFSPNSLAFPGTATEFVAELTRRWHQARPSREGGARTVPCPPATGKNGGPVVFVSYASENGDAARCVAESLLQLGAEDVWLDQKKLRGGDDWSSRIEEAIQQCDYFLPLLSAEADRRRVGVFWEEWEIALQRARQVADAFILPTLIDPSPDSRKDYQRIGKEKGTEKFFALHFLKAPQGILDPLAENDLASRFRDFERH